MRRNGWVLMVSIIVICLSGVYADEPQAESAPKIVFIGDDEMLWLCLSSDGTALSYSECVTHFKPGVELVRPLFRPEAAPFGQTGRMGHQVVKINKIEMQFWGACGENFALYKGMLNQTKRFANPITNTKKNEAYTAKIRAYLEKKTGLKFNELKILRLAHGDLDNNGQEETIVEARSGLGEKNWEINGDVVSFVGIIDGETIVDVYLLATARKDAEDDLYRASSYEHPAGLVDVDGDGKLELICEQGYYEGRGLVVYSYRNGVIKMLASNECGA